MLSMKTLETEVNLDANTLLSELDKGLRSNKMGEECEAIVGFPWLFICYPFPILINSASLKLAEVFRNGSNFSRLLILKVFQQSEKHLDKIINVDEFVRRLFNVTYSNDPIARGITLRALGIISCIVPERKNIQHTIRNSLDSLDEVEVMAAIEAASAFAKRSSDFALSIYPKVLTMINKPDTPLEVKIALFSVLHHSYYNSDIALDIRQSCLQFLSSNSSERFVAATLHTLTYIASASIFHIPSHISLLLQYLKEDPRLFVKMSTLNELKSMAKSCPHLWSKENCSQFLECTEELPKKLFQNVSLVSHILQIFIFLVKCPCLLPSEPLFTQQFHSKLVELCLSHINCDKKNIKLIDFCFQLLTALSIHSNEIKSQTVLTIEKFISHFSKNMKQDLDKENSEAIKVICVCIVTLCNSKQASQRLVTCLMKMLKDSSLPSIWVKHICEVFCSLKYLDISTDFISNIEHLISVYSQEGKEDENILTKLSTLYMQLLTRSSQQCSSQFISALGLKSHWFYYKLVRQAMRYGHHHISQILCRSLQNSASSENFHFWMLSLYKISKAESLLIESKTSSQLSVNLMTAISLYAEGLSALKAALTISNPLTFACEYVKLRFKLLQAHAALRQSANLIRTSPAFVISSSAALSSRDDLLRCGSVVTQMRKCAKEFRCIAEAYGYLHQTSFNADNQTLDHLQLLQQSCTIIAEAIESVFQTNRLSSLFVDKDTHLESNRVECSMLPSIEHKALISTCLEISNIVRTQLTDQQKNSFNGPIDCKQIALLLTISIKFLLVPLCIPRHFFQSLQNTCIKLALSPQPKSQTDLLITTSNSNFALKIEGVVVYGQSRKVLRKVSKVLLTVTTCLVNKTSNSNQDLLKLSDNNISLQSLVTPHNDYFQEQFLLSLTTLGVHNINVEASIIDKNEAQWKTGPIVSISTKVIEDPTTK